MRNDSGGAMKDWANETTGTGTDQAAQAVESRWPQAWPVLAGLTLILAVTAVVARLTAGARFDALLVVAAGTPAAVLALRLLVRDSTVSELIAAPADDRLKDMFESAGPGVVAISIDGQLTYVNPSAERMLGYHAAELVQQWITTELLAPGEGVRLVAEIEKLCGVKRAPESTPAARMVAYLNCVRMLPASRIPSFNTQVRRKDGVLIPVTLHISGLRDSTGTISGLVAIAVDQATEVRQAQTLRESRDRYRDLFENFSEMIATLSPAGRFLYANAAWKGCFELDNSTLLALDSFEDLFVFEGRSEAAALLRRTLDGEVLDRAPLRHRTPAGRVLDLELSLSLRQKDGNPLAIRCLLRDVTQQKQRERRLALELAVSRIVAERTSPEVAVKRILEAVCVSQEWDAAVHWLVDAEDKRLEFSTAWYAPGRCRETFIEESRGHTLERGAALPGRAWRDNAPVWISDLASQPVTQRTLAALGAGMVSGCAVPVRVGNSVLAVLEFYCHFCLRENREAMAAIET
ncbi:MAG: PAS domain S-box protein, partial [Terracidiphilus sp.]